MPRKVLVGAIAVLVYAALVPAAEAVPTYKDPPSYKGIKKAPPTAPPSFPTTRLATAGTFPDALVDEAGTAHIVWNDGRGDADDAARYCRLKRGATRCDAAATLLWNKTYGVGDGPQFNIDNGGPRIIRIGDQLLVLSKRYPTIGDKPDGASSSTVVGWVSNNGGSSWSSAAILGKYNLGQLALLGPSSDPIVLNLGHDPFCGMCVAAYRSGLYSTEDGSLNTDPNSNYNPTLVRDGAGAIAGFSDLQPRIWLRRWNGSGSPTDAGNWSTSAPIPGDEAQLANGPAGPFLMHRPGYFGPLQVRPLSVAGGAARPGAATPITSESGARFGRLAQDPSGRLLAAWQQDGSGVQLRTSTAGAGGFDPPQRLIAGNNNGQIDVDAAADGGGFALLNHTGGVNSPGEIVAVGFGNRAPTGRPGLGNLPGGSGDVSCQQIGFGSFQVETVEGCFLKGTGEDARTVVTGGSVNLNGLIIDPDPGARLVIDPRALTIDTIGQARVLVRRGDTEVVLFHGKVKRDLAGLQPGSRLFEFPQGEFSAEVLGFDVAAGVPVYLTETGVRIPVDIRLPGPFGGFTGQADLRAEEGAGLVIDSLRIEIGPVPLGVLVVDELVIDWKSGGTWAGSGSLTMPAGGAIAARFEFEDGGFKGAGFDYTLAPPATIGPFVYLLSVGGEFFLEPDVKIAASAALGAGAAIAGEAPVRVNGKFTMTFPKAAPAMFELAGRVSLFTVQVGEGFMRFQTDGYATFGGDARLALGPLSGGVNVGGFVDGRNGQFGADLNGDASFCAEVDLPDPVGKTGVCGDVGANAAISSIGFAACARLNPPDPIGGFTGGLAMRWEDLDPAVVASPIVLTKELIEAIAIPCSTGGYRIPPPAAVNAGTGQERATGLKIDGGLPSATILVKGAGGVPDVTVSGPGGVTIGTGAPTKSGFVAGFEGANAAWVVLDEPRAGTWTVTPNAGSPAVAQVLVSEGYEPASVKAKVARGKIGYRTRNLGAGQKVSFRESGRFGTSMIGTAKKKRGVLRFKPAPGAGGKRKVEALVVRDGLIVDRRVVGSYRAPAPPKPGPVRKLRARKAGSALTVSFRPHKRAARTAVTVKGADGTRLAQLLGRRARKARFGAVRFERRLTVSVRSLSKDGRAGPVRKVKVGSKR